MRRENIDKNLGFFWLQNCVTFRCKCLLLMKLFRQLLTAVVGSCCYQVWQVLLPGGVFKSVLAVKGHEESQDGEEHDCVGSDYQTCSAPMNLQIMSFVL